jgi:uncharacterized GH25 family protein
MQFDITCIDRFITMASKKMAYMRDNKLFLMIQGHEIWLEEYASEKSDVELSLVYGHNMRQDGMADSKRLRAFVYLEDGSSSELEIIPSDGRYLLKFKPDRDGYYTAVADMGSIVFSQTKDGYETGPKSQFKDVIYAGAFHQMAKIIVSVGRTGKFEGKLEHGILEIVPKEPHCTVGQEIELQVFYEGKPLCRAEVKAVSKSAGKEIALVRTDEVGIAAIKVTQGGDWMFLVRHRDATKKVAEAFDESVFITTLTMVAK